jgi:septal ring factor EnvC (AmiA/AmiB activator)
MLALGLSCILMGLLLSSALAAPSPSAPAGGALAKAAAQAAPKETPSTGGSATVGERITALEKENVVLREDLGKARLDTRTQLDAAAKRQAEAVAKLQKKLDEANANLEAERQKNAKRNRNLWYAVGALALGIALRN